MNFSVKISTQQLNIILYTMDGFNYSVYLSRKLNVWFNYQTGNIYSEINNNYFNFEIIANEYSQSSALNSILTAKNNIFVNNNILISPGVYSYQFQNLRNSLN